MIMTVLLLVTLISGTSILISYMVTGKKIERDMNDDFLSAEAVVDSCLTVYSRHLKAVAAAAAEELTLRQQLATFGQLSAPAENIQLRERKSEVDILFVFTREGEVIAVSEQNRVDAEILSAQPAIREKITQSEPFSLILLAAKAEQKKFFLVAGMPVSAVSGSEQKLFVLSGYVLDSAFLSRMPVHRRIGISLVSDNTVLATTQPTESYGQNPQDYKAYSSSALLPGALDILYESSFFKEKMYIKTKYIPFMKNSTPNFLVISHPSKLILATREEFSQHFLILFFVGFCSSLILVFFITGSVLNPINDLQRLVRKISEGNLSDRIDASVNNEFTPLIIQFNTMLDMIQKKDEELLDRVEAKTKELQQQNIFIDNLLRSSQIMAIAATDMDLKVTYFNPVAERLFGYKAEEVIGKKVTGFKAHIKDQEGQFNELIAKALDKGAHTFTISTADMTTYDLAKNSGHDPTRGKYRQTIEIYLSPIRARQEDGSQTVTGLMLMAQDISKAKEMDERLHAALAELQVIIDNTMLGMILLQDGRIVRINTTFENMFGCPFAEIRESAWPAFYGSVFAGKEAECWDGSGRMYFMTRKAGADGEEAQPFWCKVRRVAIDDEQQETRRELLLFEDMSSQNEMFEKIQRLSQAVEQSSNSVVITDTEGVIEYVNRTFIKLTGYQAGEVIGRSLAMLSPDENAAAAYESMRTAALAGQEWTGELVNRKKNGDLYEENVVVSPIRNEQNEITHFVVTKENITDLKKARQQADAANKAKSEFLANMSHEIRTPMNSIIGMTELLLDTALPTEQRGYLENVNSSASVLLSLINDILDFSKIEAGRLELDSHPFSIRHLAEEIIATLKILAEQKGIELRLTLKDKGTCSLLGDSLRIRQVLLNLVGNAIKFTRKGHVALEIEVQPTAAAGFCAADFRIIDTGIGIAKEQQEKIFADFTQADSSITRDYGGTGLGLSISSRLLKMMGSKIELESELGKGSTFSFSLLLENGGAKAAADMRRQEEKVNPMARQLDILLVEDNPANQQLAVILLVKQGHQVTVASSGAEALVCLSKHCYDLIFMDMQMPVMDGLTATRHIRKIEQGLPTDLPPELAEITERLRERLLGGHLHIIAVTANALQEDRQQCLDAGMDEYLSKPYKKISMLRVLQQFDQGSPAPLGEQPEAPVIQPQEEMAVVSLTAVKQHIMKQFELEQADAEEVLAAYADSLKENLDNLHQLLEKGQGTEAGRQAHALKGSLLNLGQESLAEIALALEKELPKQIEAKHQEMVIQLAHALKELTA
ncbi:PAS domain S-box protein [Candidatus Electronema sp. PJ]|uniref:PAS domain S-box protein n=1 Tax=Candidatus Electronema sp. PJ TaxID=3401572 RepID=UPI003AA7F358